MDEELYIQLFYVGMLVVIGVSLSLFINTNLVEDKAYKDKYLSKDLALLHDSLIDNEGVVEIDLVEEERIVYDRTEDCSFLVNLEKSYCGKNTVEGSNRNTIKTDKISINSGGGEVNLNGRS